MQEGRGLSRPKSNRWVCLTFLTFSRSTFNPIMTGSPRWRAVFDCLRALWIVCLIGICRSRHLVAIMAAAWLCCKWQQVRSTKRWELRKAWSRVCTKGMQNLQPVPHRPMEAMQGVTPGLTSSMASPSHLAYAKAVLVIDPPRRNGDDTKSGGPELPY